MMKQQFLMVAFVLPLLTFGQNTKTLSPGQPGQPAKITDVEWIAGHWRGEAFGGVTEEIWSPPLGGSMMCSFKLVKDGKVSFYEFVTIVEEAGSLLVRLKHFHGNLIGWEEKDKTVDFLLVKIEGNRAYFDGMTFERTSADELTVYVMIGKKGEEKEVKFAYKRIGI